MVTDTTEAALQRLIDWVDSHKGGKADTAFRGTVMGTLRDVQAKLPKTTTADRSVKLAEELSLRLTSELETFFRCASEGGPRHTFFREILRRLRAERGCTANLAILDAEERGAADVSVEEPASEPPGDLVISLTNEAPIRICMADWPVLARCLSSATKIGDTTTAAARITVRQHADGRAVIYGTRYGVVSGTPDRRAGMLRVAGADIPQGVYAIGNILTAGSMLAEEVIATLPVRDI